MMGTYDYAPLMSSLAAENQRGAEGISVENNISTASILQTPYDHFQCLFGNQTGHGRVLISWRPERQPKWFKLNQATAQDTLTKWVSEPDIYITPNIFYGWRLTRLLHSLTSFYVDIDFHDNPGRVDFAREVTNVMQKIEALHWPDPNFIVYTGRGFHIYWLIEPAPAAALPRWQAVQRELVKQLNGDRRVVDNTRVMRLIGSTNSKAGNCKVSAEHLHDQRYTFDWFCNEVLPLHRSEVRDIRAAGAKRRDTDAPPRNVAGSIYQRWYLVYRDLLKICDHYWFGGVPEGHRDHMIYHMANALSWFTIADSLENEITALAQIWTPSLSKREALNYTSTVVQRAKATQKNPSQEQRYRYKRSTLWDEFSDIVDEDLLPSLRAIIPDGLAAERESERQGRRDRVAEGRYQKTREAITSEAENQRRKIRRMLSQGHTHKNIAERLGVSRSRVTQIAGSIDQKKSNKSSNDVVFRAKRG